MISKSIKGTSQQIKKEKTFSITILNLPKTSNSILKFDMHKSEGFLICLIHNKEELMYTTNNTPYYQHARTSKCMEFMIIHHCCFFALFPFYSYLIQENNNWFACALFYLFVAPFQQLATVITCSDVWISLRTKNGIEAAVTSCSTKKSHFNILVLKGGVG